MKKVYYVLFFLLLSETSFGQISGIINDYTKVTAIDPACNKLTVVSSAAFSVGDTVLIIQMKGATIDETNATTFGNINPASNINNAGNYEFAQISAIQTNDIFLKHTIRNYTVSGFVQLVSVPQYTDVTITGTLQAKTWNSTDGTGGVIVFEASGTVTMNADIDVSETGFRGGSINSAQGTTCNVSNIYAPTSSSISAGKGEGIAAFILNKESGRGKQANGGGGGNSNNCGGGGGGNFGAGGLGGKQAYVHTSAFGGCNLSGGGNPGLGGLALTYANADNKIFLGGGGGSGHQNNLTGGGPPSNYGGTYGGHGGGIVIINATTIDANSFSILAKGGLSPISKAYGDGAGGGGGGGTVLLNVTNYSSAITIDVTGGKGDDVRDETSRDLGPGGGGGGGMLWVNSPAINPSITLLNAGGANGVTIQSAGSNCQCAHGSLPGSTGGSLTNLSLQKGSAIFNQTCILPVELLNFTAKRISEKVKLEWTTASEKDNQFFTLERTSDLANFTKVGTIKGSDNSTEPVSYFIYDDYPLEGVSYYRLSQTDIDGTTKIIGVTSVKNILRSEKLILSVYPVPFQNTITLELNRALLSSDSEATIKILNALGELVFESTRNISSLIELDLPELPAGIYSIVLSCDDQMEIIKIIKGN